MVWHVSLEKMAERAIEVYTGSDVKSQLIMVGVVVGGAGLAYWYLTNKYPLLSKVTKASGANLFKKFSSNPGKEGKKVGKECIKKGYKKRNIGRVWCGTKGVIGGIFK